MRQVGVPDWSRDFGDVPEKSPIFWSTYRVQQKSPRVPNGDPDHLGTFPRSSKVPGTQGTGEILGGKGPRAT